MTQAVDSVALLPAYLAAGTAVLVLLADLAVARWRVTVLAAAAGAVATGVAAVLVAPGRLTFCAGDGCSYLTSGRSALVGVLFALLTLGVLGLSAPLLRSAAVPAGEYCFLLACSMTGGVVLGAAGDLITLIVALETLTLPLYVLVGARRTSLPGATAAVTFFVVSVVATAVTLLGAALLYAGTGHLHLSQLGAALAGDLPAGQAPLVSTAAVLVVLGLAFKVAAVPFHAWAPTTYDGAPVPVAAYLSTASKLGGVVALLAVTATAWPAADGTVDGMPALPVEWTGPVLATIAVLTMTVGNLVALRQTRMIRLLAWSSVAQAGYMIAPLGALSLVGGDHAALAAATVAYTVFFVVLEFAAFGAVVALRPAGADGGEVAAYRGAGRRRPLVAAALVLALVGLAGLPPGLAGLFAKVTVVRALLLGDAGWLAVVVALNAVVGLAYYVRVAATLYASPTAAGSVADDIPGASPRRAAWPVAVALAVATAITIVLGFAPQLVLDVATR
ncbi:NADH-quinone oxidoreductase subunit N [Plantactinospora sp. GCM10030261]|uniref:NADH-quinone oxidoreductase subunit N n=1 Tax=Plantactinospora sp. GCM10030261 TaxID=3273420 RepID=UPI00360B029B